MRRFAASLGLLTWLCGSGLARGESPGDPIAAYERQAVGVRTIVPLALDGKTVDRAARPAWDVFQGPDNHPIDEKTFFRVVGREDLVRRYDHKLAVKRTLKVTGGIAIATGLTWSLVTLLSRPRWAASNNCNNPCTDTGAWPGWIDPRLGLGLAAVGVVPYLIGAAIDPTPIDAQEASALARQYDRQLRARLGLSDLAVSW